MTTNKIYFVIFIIICLSFCNLTLNILKLSNIKNVTSQGLDIRKYIGLNNVKYKKFSGKDITVAIIDSGISLHNDINVDRIKVFKDFINYKESAYDDYGHGTAIAGIIGANGQLKGIAPNVDFVIVKTLDSDGKADRDTLCKAIDWVKDNMEIYNVKVVNISAGVIPFPNFSNDPLTSSIDKLKEKGVIVVCSAGNNGPYKKSILSPGNNPKVITVGSCKNNKTYSYLDDYITQFSSRGDFANGLCKPDIVTMGVDIYSLDFKDKNGYSIHSGTSYSTGIVTGVIAILLEKYQNSQISYIEKLIKSNTFEFYSTSVDSQGKGALKLK